MRTLLVAALLAWSSVAVGQPADVPGAEKEAAANDSLMLDVGEVLDDLLWPEPYLYQSAGARDPFVSLLAEETEGDLSPLRLDELIVVGILWGERDRFALVETRRGKNMILRKGDTVGTGHVVEVLPDGLRLKYRYYGVIRTITLPVTSGVEEKDER